MSLEIKIDFYICMPLLKKTLVKIKYYLILIFELICLMLFYGFVKYKPSEIPQGYTKDSIITLIKQLPEYQGDNVKINIINRVCSEDKLINSVIDEMYKVKINLNNIKQMAIRTGEPEQVWVYKMAIYYYLQQYDKQLKKQKK